MKTYSVIETLSCLNKILLLLLLLFLAAREVLPHSSMSTIFPVCLATSGRCVAKLGGCPFPAMALNCIS